MSVSAEQAMTFEEAVNAELAKGHHVNIAQAERFWNAATTAERERCAAMWDAEADMAEPYQAAEYFRSKAADVRGR